MTDVSIIMLSFFAGIGLFVCLAKGAELTAERVRNNAGAGA